MVNWSRVCLVFRRELLDQIRDRRTVIMLIGLPFLLYLVFGVGFVHLAATFVVEPSTVVIVGAPDSAVPEFLQDGRIASKWVASDATPTHRILSSNGSPETPLIQRASAAAKRYSDASQTMLGQTETNSREDAPLQPDHPEQIINTFLREHNVDVLIAIPDGFGAVCAGDDADSTCSARSGPPSVFYNSTNVSAVRAARDLLDSLDQWQRSVREHHLIVRFENPELPPPSPRAHDVATHTQRMENMWAMMFPALIVVMTVLATFYPAIDMCAGERERGTLETLLVCPASRAEIVLGKFLTVLSFSCLSASLNLISLGLIAQTSLSFVAQQSHPSLQALQLPSLLLMGGVMVLMVLIAGPFSALALALSSMARSSKEAQFFVSPLLAVALILTVGCMLPGAQITLFHCLLPVVGPTLWLREYFVAGLTSDLLIQLAFVTVASVGWSLIALMVTVEQFRDESILFPDTEPFRPVAGLRQMLTDRAPTPSPMIAGLCFIGIILLQLVSAQPLAGWINTNNNPSSLLAALVTQQAASLLIPTCCLGLLFTRSLWSTLGLRPVRFQALLAGVVLAYGAHPLMFEFSQLTKGFFPPLPGGLQRVLEVLNQAETPLLWLLLALAVIPGICEEVAFRGFILSGLNSKGRAWLAVVLSSLLFGAMHIVPHQSFNAAVLGVPLAMMSLTVRSTLPAIVFHVTYNGLELARGRVAHAGGGQIPATLAHVLDGEFHYTLVTLTCSAAMLLAGSAVILRSRSDA